MPSLPRRPPGLLSPFVEVPIGSQYDICFPHEFNNIVFEGCKDLRMRLEFYTPLKKGFILQSKGALTFKQFAAALSAAKLFSTFF